MDELYDDSIARDNEKFDAAFSGYITGAFFCDEGVSSSTAPEMILRQVYVKPNFVFGTILDNR